MSTTVVDGEIRPEVLYHKIRAQEITGWGQHAWRTATRAINGLKVKHAGGRCYVRGAELIRYIEENGKACK